MTNLVVYIAMVIVGAAGYVKAPKSWLPEGKAQGEGQNGLSSNDNTVVTPQSVRMALSYMSEGMLMYFSSFENSIVSLLL